MRCRENEDVQGYAQSSPEDEVKSAECEKNMSGVRYPEWTGPVKKGKSSLSSKDQGHPEEEKEITRGDLGSLGLTEELGKIEGGILKDIGRQSSKNPEDEEPSDVESAVCEVAKASGVKSPEKRCSRRKDNSSFSGEDLGHQCAH